MTTFADIIRNQGFKNTGDNLLGFQIDMDAFLGESDLFEWVDVSTTKDENCMVVAKCKLKPNVHLDQAKQEVCRIWNDSLRYQEFENHSMEDTSNGFLLNFVTLAKRLGVVGRIECFTGNTDHNKHAIWRTAFSCLLSLA